MLDAIKEAQPGQIIRDKGEPASVPGLELRVVENTRGGTVARRWFYYHRTRAGEQRRPKLGEYPQVSLAEARKRAAAIQAQVAVGEDPGATWEAARGEKTVNELWDAVKADYYSQERFQVSGWGRVAEWMYNKHFRKLFGGTRLSALRTADIRAWHAAHAHMATGANRALAVLKKMFQWAIEHEWRPQGSNPAILVKPHGEESRERYATDEELARLGAILAREVETRPAQVAFVYLLLLSGARPRAIERATWDELTVFEKDGRRHGLLVFYGKTANKTSGGKRVRDRVVLPPEAMAVLDRLPRVAGATITGMKAPREWWARIRVEAGCPDLWMRDARRTFATVGMSACGIAMERISPVIGHRDTNTTAIYAKLVPAAQVEVAGEIATSVWGKLGAGGK